LSSTPGSGCSRGPIKVETIREDGEEGEEKGVTVESPLADDQIGAHVLDLINKQK